MRLWIRFGSPRDDSASEPSKEEVLVGPFEEVLLMSHAVYVDDEVAGYHIDGEWHMLAEWAEKHGVRGRDWRRRWRDMKVSLGTEGGA